MNKNKWKDNVKFEFHGTRSLVVKHQMQINNLEHSCPSLILFYL